MLKKRLTACIVLKNNFVVQSINFNRYLPVGSLPVTVEFLNNWGIDEIVILDIDAAKYNRKPNFDLIKKAAERCRVPLAIGGGITSVEDIKKLMHCGADKVVINAAALARPDFITEAANVFGNQCIVVSMDVSGDNKKNYFVYSHISNKSLGINPVEWAKQVESLGAGELFVTSVNRDGSKSGYDIELINIIARSVNIPVIASGGAGKPEDVLDLFKKTNASAASVGNYFHFFEHSVNITKAILSKNSENVRIDDPANYLESQFIDNCRLAKKSDEFLENLLYKKIIKETI